MGTTNSQRCRSWMRIAKIALILVLKPVHFKEFPYSFINLVSQPCLRDTKEQRGRYFEWAEFVGWPDFEHIETFSDLSEERTKASWRNTEWPSSGTGSCISWWRRRGSRTSWTAATSSPVSCGSLHISGKSRTWNRSFARWTSSSGRGSTRAMRTRLRRFVYIL